MYSVLRKNTPKAQKNPSMITPLPTLKRRSANRCIGSIGWAVRRSQATKPVRSTTARPKASSTRPEVQPSSAPSMIPYRRATMPPTDTTAPTGSSGVVWLSRDLGDIAAITTAASRTTGRFTSTVEPHQ
jgi:hypothetical protein